jgi:hypothetical protein
VSTVFARLIAYFFVGVLCAVGPVLLLIAIGSSIPTAKFVLASPATDGKIINLQHAYSTRRSKEDYKPVVRFTASNGQTHMFIADSRAGLVSQKTGDTIPVLYLNDHPETARIGTFVQLWMAQFVLGIVGVSFTIVPVRILIRRKARSRATDVT